MHAVIWLNKIGDNVLLATSHLSGIISGIFTLLDLLTANQETLVEILSFLKHAFPSADASARLPPKTSFDKSKLSPVLEKPEKVLDILYK
jgi:hypothetical protein